MNLRIWSPLLLTGMIGLIGLSSASAQRGKSDNRTDDPFADLDVAPLDARLGSRLDFSGSNFEEWKLDDAIRGMEDLRGLDSRVVRDVLRSLQKNPGQLEKYLADIKAGKISEADRKKLTEDVQRKILERKKRPDKIESGNDSSSGTDRPRKDKSGPTDSSGNPDRVGKESGQPEWVEKAVDGLVGAFKEAGLGEEGDRLKELVEAFMNDSPLPFDFDFNDFLTRLSESAPDLSHLLPKGFDMPDLSGYWNNLSLPALPDIRLPNLGGMPGPPSISGPGLAASGTLLLWIAGIAILLAVLWKVVIPSEGDEREGRGRAWRLGAWPIAPNRVSTRGELIAAFEYLVLLQLGFAARTRHHLDLAAGLGARPGSDPDRRRTAAGRLGRLYEQARYAPAEEALDAAALADARHDLCYLAGVAVV